MTWVWTAAAIAGALLLVETAMSRRNETRLRARGAVEPPDDPYPLMRVVYPLCFLGAVIEAALTSPPSPQTAIAGTLLFASAKALKYWCMASLGPLWSFRVLVLPGQPLVDSGPYRWLRHPNYVAVIGEIAAFAAMMGAPAAGVIAVAVFIFILRRRIEVEETALGLR